LAAPLPPTERSGELPGGAATAAGHARSADPCAAEPPWLLVGPLAAGQRHALVRIGRLGWLRRIPSDAASFSSCTFSCRLAFGESAGPAGTGRGWNQPARPQSPTHGPQAAAAAGRPAVLTEFRAGAVPRRLRAEFCGFPAWKRPMPSGFANGSGHPDERVFGAWGRRRPYPPISNPLASWVVLIAGPRPASGGACRSFGSTRASRLQHPIALA